jgi:hypothetical protein
VGTAFRNTPPAYLSQVSHRGARTQEFLLGCKCVLQCLTQGACAQWRRKKLEMNQKLLHKVLLTRGMATTSTGFSSHGCLLEVEGLPFRGEIHEVLHGVINALDNSVLL